MASLTIRNLDNDLKARLRLRAARHGRSMEAEARTILSQTLNRSRFLNSAMQSSLKYPAIRRSLSETAEIHLPNRFPC